MEELIAVIIIIVGAMGLAIIMYVDLNKPMGGEAYTPPHKITKNETFMYNSFSPKIVIVCDDACLYGESSKIYKYFKRMYPFLQKGTASALNTVEYCYYVENGATHYSSGSSLCSRFKGFEVIYSSALDNNGELKKQTNIKQNFTVSGPLTLIKALLEEVKAPLGADGNLSIEHFYKTPCSYVVFSTKRKGVVWTETLEHKIYYLPSQWNEAVFVGTNFFKKEYPKAKFGNIEVTVDTDRKVVITPTDEISYDNLKRFIEQIQSTQLSGLRTNYCFRIKSGEVTLGTMTGTWDQICHIASLLI